MRTNHWRAVAFIAGSLALHAQTATQIIDQAATAMGGKERILAVKTLTFEGNGTDLDEGFSIRPSDDVQAFYYLLDFKRQLDVANERMHVEQTRAAAWPFAGTQTVNRQSFGVDGKVAFNINANGSTRVSDAVAEDRRIQMLHHPVMILRAALAPNAKLSNARKQGNLDLLDITTAEGDKISFGIDSKSHLPAKAMSMIDHPNLGDTAKETLFWNYQDVNGLKLPARLKTKLDKYIELDLEFTKISVDANVGDLAASATVKTQAPPVPPVQEVTVREVGKGIWHLAGTGNHFSIVFEFDDHLTLFEVPSEARAIAVIAKARTLRPGKPLTQVVVSHHHFDHSGGLRVAVAEGLTVITHKDNVDFFKELVARPHTLRPDLLAKNPKPLKIIPVDDEYTLKDKSLEVKLYHVLKSSGNFREGTLLYAYVPRDKIVVQADLYDSTWGRYAWADVFLWNLNYRKLQVEQDVPVHGAIQSFADVVKTLQARPNSLLDAPNAN